MVNQFPDPQTTNILAVDDTRANLRLLTSILTNKGYNVRPVPSARLALSSVEAKPPDLILLDIDMPEMTGYEVCEQLKADERFRDIPIIFISVLSETLDKVKAFSVGGVDYITKPFQAEEVLARVQTHLALHKTRQELQTQNIQLQQEIIERKQIEEALVVSRNQAQEASRLKSEIISRVGHELRTPLSVILGYTEVFRDEGFGSVNKTQNKILTDIIQSGRKLGQIVNELIYQAQLEAKKVALDIEPVIPIEIVSHVQEKMELLAQAKDLMLTWNVAEEVPTTVLGDQRWLKHILTNLVGNAIKFTENGSIQINCFCPDTNHWALQVIDTGIGFSEAEQETIFKPFEQADGSITRKYGGLGLGLSTVKQLTQMMEGEISFKSEVGQGSTFTVTLPLNPGNEKKVTETQSLSVG